MPSAKYVMECRICKKKTRHIIRVVTDQMPPDTHVVECQGCGVNGIALIKLSTEVMHIPGDNSSTNSTRRDDLD